MTLLKKVPVSFSTRVLAINQDVRALVPAANINGRFIAWTLTAMNRQLMKLVSLAGHGTGRLAIDDVLNLDLLWPDDRSQKLLCELLDGVEDECVGVGALVVAKRQFKRGLMEELLTGRRRFAEQARKDIPMARLGEHTSELVVRNQSGWGRDRVMGVLQEAGLVPMRDRIRTGNLARYKVIPPDAFAYNPMRLNIGSIARNLETTPNLVSPDYVVFQANGRTLLPAYLDQLRKSSGWRRFVTQAGSGSVRMRIYYNMLATMTFPLPTVREQRCIVDILESYDREIATLESLRNAYSAQKHALLDKLLSGAIRIPA